MTEGVREIQVHDDKDRQPLNGKDTFSLTTFSSFSSLFFFGLKETRYFSNAPNYVTLLVSYYAILFLTQPCCLLR